jgi:predicted AAA+ superfamily ATPase
MQRKILADLRKWKDDSRRKPLILYGVRQAGKTWVMKKFGVEHFKHTAYINFDHNLQAQRIFAQDLRIERILHDLAIETRVPIDPAQTLIVFDEVQECPSALTSLKYFCEEAPHYHVVAAGSLLGVAQHEGTGFPVGKVDMLTLYPLSFQEFLSALEEDAFVELIKTKNFAGTAVFSGKIIERLKQFFYIGGMPEAVVTYRETQDLNRVRKVQENILHAYYGDFSKHIPAHEIAKVRLIWDSLPAQLGKENKRFLYSAMKPGSKGRDYEIALEWLKNAGLIHQIKRVSRPCLPLDGYQQNNIFKVYTPDIGLLSARAGLDITSYIDADEKVFHHFKGGMAEQFVLQELRTAIPNLPIYYWANDKNTAEIDFVVQFHNTIIPIEVKSGENVRGNSLKTYMSAFEPPIAIRASLLNYSRNGTLHTIPLYMMSEFAKIAGS